MIKIYKDFLNYEKYFLVLICDTFHFINADILLSYRAAFFYISRCKIIAIPVSPKKIHFNHIH